MRVGYFSAWLAVVLFVCSVQFSAAGEFTVFGPSQFERSASKSVEEVAIVQSPFAGSNFTVIMRNGDESGGKRISSGSVTLNGIPVVKPADLNQKVGSIERVIGLGKGANELSVLLNGKPGALVSIQIVGRDDLPPVIQLTEPLDGAFVDTEKLYVSGSIVDETPTTATVNGAVVTVDSSGFWSTEIPLIFGPNQIDISATDLGGNTTILSLSVTREDRTPPEIQILSPADGSETEEESTDIAGTVLDETAVAVTVNGVVAVVDGDSFVVTGVSLAVGENRVEALATDEWGNSASASIVVIREAPQAAVEPQPEGSFGARYEDLIPSDATKDSYDPKRFSLITGEVKDLSDQPLSGVTVSVGANSCVECHGLEYGSVKTDEGGRFTIPVEGGSTMTVAYKKPGLITSHRQVYVPWNGYAVAETIQMLPEDTAATTVTFDGNPETVVAHRGTPVSDEFGTRSATMVFTGDNMAYEVDAGGNVIRELKTVTTRATEFVTPESMPAKLPPNSAYTYCAEFSVDGVERVKFAKPVTGWVDNFLGFDVGEIVPVGYYDRDRGVWVPSDNGVVVMLLDTDGDGVVDALDSDADNLPNDLNGDGSFSDEVQGLQDSSRYQPGTSFWRFSVSHFTPWDCNWPYGPPKDATPPNPEGEPDVDQQDDDDGPCGEDDQTPINSYVRDRSRVFHEDIAIPGTDMTLHYASDRVEGYKTKISVPASGATVPASLKRIIVRVKVAGRLFVANLPPLPNQKSEFNWDGLDRLGRPVVDSVNAHVEIGFVYDAVYIAARASISRAFANAGSDVTGVQARQEITSWRRTRITVNAGKIGPVSFADGWAISVHHTLSPDELVVYKGNGGKIEVKNDIITTFAGLLGPAFGGDGGLAVQAGLIPFDMSVDAAGNLYIADSYNNRIRKVDTSGIITTVAGNGSKGFGGDGGAATLAALDNPKGVAVDTVGNLYIADSSNNRIRKVDSAGIITTVAGNGNSDFSGDGGAAIQAAFDNPFDVAVDTVGNLYIVDYNNQRIRKVDTAGIITTVAGNGGKGFGGDGDSAVDAMLRYPTGVAADTIGNLYIADSGNHLIRKVDSAGIITRVAGYRYGGYGSFGGDGRAATRAGLASPYDVAVDAVGNLYIADRSNRRIRKVDTAGIISSVAGDGRSGYRGDGGLAVNATLGNPVGVAVDANNNLYIADVSNRRIRMVGLSKLRTIAGSISVPEENGSGHIMSIIGQHQMTIDMDTGVTLRTFDYDVNDKLTAITDQFGNVTTINRDANGVPVSIVSPDGLVTTLTVDPDTNHLARVAYPDNSSYTFEYSPDGLMTAEIDPGNNRFEHLFDSSGRLTDVTDPELGHWNYSRTALANGDILVVKSTGEGNVTTYQDHAFSTGASTSTITGPNGGVTATSRSADGLSETKNLSCGTELAIKYGLDTEYKYKFAEKITESMPSGLARSTLRDRTYQDVNADEIPDLITETVTANGNATTSVQNVLLSQTEVNSPLGRTVTSSYHPATLLTRQVSVAGLNDINYAYDTEGRPTSISQGSRQTSFAYTDKGFLASVTDTENRATTYAHDLMGRVTAVNRPDGSMIGFNYDNNGNMTVLTNPSSVGHSFDYNGTDYKTGYQTPLSGSYRYVYDKDRRLVDTFFPSGQRITNFYDRGRLAGIMTPEGEIELNYLCATKLGSMTKGGESISYTYDGKLVTSETASGTLNQTLGYVYNNDFNVTGFTYAGSTVAYAYDNDGLLTGAGSFTVARNAGNGLPESVSNGGFVLTRAFNGYGEVEGETTAIGGIDRFAYSLNRSPAGRIVDKTENVAGAASNYAYAYDERGQLLTVKKNGALVEEYRYNVNGARKYEMNSQRGIAGRTFTYSDEDHLLSAGDNSYQYNLDGFLTTKTEGTDVTAYDYSSRGELLSVTLPDATAIEYIHDPKGRRIAKKVNGVIVEKYLWQGLTRLQAVYDGSDNLVMRFRYADARMPMEMDKGAATYYLAYDQVGSLRAVTDASGNIVKQVEYDSFGNILVDSNPAFTVPFGFAGGLHDRDINLIRFGYRDYDPEVGRWAAKDPIGFAGGDVDLYGYTFNSPINWIDTIGLASLSTSMGIGYTTFDPRPEDPNGRPYSIPTSNAVDSRSLPGAQAPFSTEDVSVVPSTSNKNAYGADGAYIDTGDPRGRDIHGGGSCLDAPLADRQGWCKTFGCTRGQNEDVIELGRRINDFKSRHPDVAIPYTRW
jgi:RHS repeat-associated protein